MNTTTRPSRGSRATRLRRASATALASLLLLHVAGATAQELDQTIDADQPVLTDAAELVRGHVDIGPRFEPDGWQLLIHDDLEHDGEGSSAWRLPERTVLRIGDAAALQVPEGDDYAFLGVEGGAEVHVVPQTQDPEVVWLGWNTQDPEVMATIDRGVTLSLVGVEGPGELLVFLQSGSFEEPDVIWDSRTPEVQPAWIPVNTHAHANWVFTEPGTYLVRFDVTADLVDGSTVSDTADLRFAVGDAADGDEVLEATFTTDAPEPEDETATAGDGAPVAADEAGTSTASNVAMAAAALAIAMALLAGVLIVRGRREKARAAAQAGS
jgi:surface-anchored protein